ncbi:MAG: metallophosphoesterase family protein [Balneolaceae bacterium]
MSDIDKFVAIGDIHGCARSNAELLKKLNDTFGSNRKYIFLGDYIDRGPNSKEVVNQLLEFGKNHECIFLRGNHDEMLLKAYENDDWDLWLANGGRSTLMSYHSTQGNLELPVEHYQFFQNTKIWWETDHYFFVHGGISPDLTIQENLESEFERSHFMWQRDHVYSRTNNWDKTVVFGHTPVKNPIIEDNMIGIDTGCVYADKGFGFLSAVLLPEVEFVKQECLDI